MTNNKFWVTDGSKFSLSNKENFKEKINNGIYILKIDEYKNFYLEKLYKNFSFHHKIYGVESDFIKRVVKTYSKTSNNLGVLFNGFKGSGKTVTCKILCNELNLPIILIDSYYENCVNFINEIPQDVIIFIDEYEKIFKEQHDLLTVMDGVLNSSNRRVFLLTTNEIIINQNLMERPSRIRYFKTFDNLSKEVIIEVVDDLLINEDLKEDVITFLMTLDIVTIDVIKSVIEEVNIHNESPTNFKDVLNVKIKIDSHVIKFLKESENGEFKILFIDFNVTDLYRHLYDKVIKVNTPITYNDIYYGRIKKVLGKDIYLIKIDMDEEVYSNFQHKDVIVNGGEYYISITEEKGLNNIFNVNKKLINALTV